MPVVETRIAEGLLLWTLDNPPRRNALDPAMLGWIRARAPTLSGEVVLLTGAGDQVFSAGFDLKALARLAEEDPATLPDQLLIDASSAMTEADATFVALLQGLVIGAGVELACACDLRLARPGVTFSVPASKLGVVYHAAGLLRFHAVFGAALARRLLLCGERISAEEALSVGALAHLVPAEELTEAGEAVGRRLLAGAPHSLRAHRDFFRRIERLVLPTDLLAEHSALRTRSYAAADLGSAHRRALGRKS